MKAFFKFGLFMLGLSGLTCSVYAQQTEVTVPDVRGLSVPEAAASLNREGLRLGAQTSIGWTAESNLPENSVQEQSVAAGTVLSQGAAVDITVLRTPNVRLLYDDNDLTLINLTNQPLNVAGLSFSAVEGSTASFAARRWAQTLRENQCLQLWSVSRNGPKDVAGCRLIQTWFSTTNAAEHFWTQSSGAQRFQVLDNGIERAVCQAAAPNSQDTPTACEFYISGSGAASEVTPYIYFAYTPEVIAMINNSADRWMPTRDTLLHNYNPNISVPGAGLRFGDPELYGSLNTVASITQLAPGQCLVMTSDNPNAVPPQPCDVIAQLDLGSNVAFWLADFEMESVTDGQRHTCAAAVEDKLTICIMPR